jgi:hypothetical protein
MRGHPEPGLDTLGVEPSHPGGRLCLRRADRLRIERSDLEAPVAFGGR